MKTIDIGINLMNEQFNGDRNSVIERALEHGVKQMIITGTNVEKSVKAAEFVKKFSEKNRGVFHSTAGIHPHDARYLKTNDNNVLKELLIRPEVVAVGECGLDFDRDRSPRDIQEKVFRMQLELARELKMPIFLHERDAHKRFIEIMDEYRDLIPQSVVHCFTGNSDEVKDYISRGFYIGITGWVCDNKRGRDLQEAVRHIPLDRIMVETDGPYLAPKDLKQRPKKWRNEPMYLPHIVKSLAKYMEVDAEKLAEVSTENAKRFFGI